MPPSHRPSHPPSWWPENEPWPPNGPPHWRNWPARNRPGHFFWRFGCAVVVLMLLALLGCGTLVWLLSGGPAPSGERDIWRGISFVVIILGALALWVVGRTLRRTTQPIEEMMDAAKHVAQGDYALRVTERGPREVRHLTHAFNTMTERLQTNAEQRRRLLADISHELRTPLTVMQGNVEGMLDGVYQPDHDHLEAILEETRVMARLIDDLRTLALTESGTLQLQREPVEPGALVAEAVASFRDTAQSAGVHLNADIAADLPTLEIDPARIHQVLTNLIANALHYTASGGTIRVTCAQKGTRLEVSVADSGRGIAPADLPHIFDRYFKSSDSRGSGLGLAIAKDLVETHGGQITAQSQIGQGTVITVTLPIT